MSKNFITIIVFSILLVIFINGFSASYTSRKIGNLAYVLALGIDVGEKAKLKVSAQFTKSASVSPGSGTSAEDIDNIVGEHREFSVEQIVVNSLDGLHECIVLSVTCSTLLIFFKTSFIIC